MTKNNPHRSGLSRWSAVAALSAAASLPLHSQTLFDFEDGTAGWTARANNATVEQQTQVAIATSGTGVLAVTAGDDGWYQAANVTLQTNHAGHQTITAGSQSEDPMVLAFDVVLDPEMDGDYRATRANPWININFRIEAGQGAEFISQFTELGGVTVWPDEVTHYTAEIPLNDVPLAPGAPITLILMFNTTEAYDFTVYVDNFRVAAPGGEVVIPEGPVGEAMTFFGVDSESESWIVLPENLGWLDVEFFPWIYSLTHQWLYVNTSAPFATGTWFYDLNRADWWYTGANGIYPWVFSGTEGWIVLEEAVSD